MQKIKVLIVDDSALIRKLLTEIFNDSGCLEVVGAAADPYEARDMIKKLNPDVLTLDIEMPKMDGITFLSNLMRLRPMPVIMISTLTETGAEATLKALDLGAVDFVPKPKIDVVHALQDYANEIVEKVKMAARAKIKGQTIVNRPAPTESTKKNLTANLVLSQKYTVDAVLPHCTDLAPIRKTEKLIALGSSTGGTEAIKVVIASLPQSTPAIVISQHLPVAFSASFVKHLDAISPMKVNLAEEGQKLLAGNIYVAPGDKHLLVQRENASYVCRLNDGPAVNRHKPSVDVMFRSVAQHVGSNAIGVMLTGMGADGALCMKEMRDVGAKNIVQDEESSVVWGMPGEAYRLGAAEYLLPLSQIAACITKLSAT